jgi:hypothetical protein
MSRDATAAPCNSFCVNASPRARTKALMMAFRLLEIPEEDWRKMNGAEHLPLVRAGVRFVDDVQEKLKNAARKVKENAA